MTPDEWRALVLSFGLVLAWTLLWAWMAAQVLSS